MAFGWQGERIRLVPVDADKHLENYFLWLNDPEITSGLLVGDRPLTRLNEIDYLKTIGNDLSEVSFAIETLDGVHIGATGIHRIDHANRTCMTGIFIGDKTVWGQGLGVDVVRTRARYCFEQLGMQLLRSSHLQGNLRSRGMLLKAGYKEVGVWPKRFWRDGQFRDEHLFALLREDWEATN